MQSVKQRLSATDLFDHLTTVFPRRAATPNKSHATIMYEAGHEEVIRYISTYLNKVASKTVVKAVANNELPDSIERSLRSAFGGTSEV